jgi:hypothetical protein
MTIFVILFGAAIRYIWVNRRKASFRTRSPHLIIVGFCFTMGSCILNTTIVTEFDYMDSPWRSHCRMEIILIVFCFIGFLSIYFARMWRIYNVFGLYQDYLDERIQSIKEEIEIQD